MSWEIREGDCLRSLRAMPAESVQTCITSPPYWGLRDYGDPGQLGLEPTPEQYVANMVEVFAEVRRVLRDDGTCWLNLGDSYNGSGGVGGPGKSHTNQGSVERPDNRAGWSGLKPKDLVGIPWRVAFALQADGWYLRSDIIWAKPNPMPESVTDRPTKAHEYLFLLSKSPRYFYDADAIREGASEIGIAREGRARTTPAHSPPGAQPNRRESSNGEWLTAVRNKRTVWTVATQPFKGAHFAVFPPKLIEPCVLAGSPPKRCGECGAPWERVTERTAATVLHPGSDYNDKAGRNDGHRGELVGAAHKTLGWQPTCEHNDDTGSAVVLDPFSGSGTTGMVALRHDRSYIGLELSSEYAAMSRNRIRDDAPLFNHQTEAAA